MNQQGPSMSVPDNTDPSWRGLYLAGGILGFLYILSGIIVPALLFVLAEYKPDSDGLQTLQFIGQNRAWWIIEQIFVLAPSILVIVTFMSVFLALKGVNKTYAAIGTMGAIVSQVLFLAYFPIVMGLVDLSDRYLIAATIEKRTSLVAAAECLVAQNRSIGPSEAILAISVLILSVVMLKGVFHRLVAYVGILTCVAYVVSMFLRPTIGISYFFWYAFYLVWLVAVAFRLLRLGLQNRQEGNAAPADRNGVRAGANSVEEGEGQT